MLLMSFPRKGSLTAAQSSLSEPLLSGFFIFPHNFKFLSLTYIFTRFLLLSLVICSLSLCPKLSWAAPKGDNSLFNLRTRIYSSRAGDSLNSIAEAFNISTKQLIALNPGKKFNFPPDKILSPGTLLNVPNRAPLADSALGKNANNYNGERRSGLATAPSPRDGRGALNLVSSEAFGQTSAAARRFETLFNPYGNLRIKVAGRDLRNNQLGADLLFPLYDRGPLLLFGQNSISYEKDRTQLNGGLGARYFGPSFAVGANSFVDYDIGNKLARLGAGAEFWQNYVHFALNGYFALPNSGASSYIHDGDFYQHKVVSGLDLRAAAYLPFYPQIGVTSAFEQYFGNNVDLFSNHDMNKNPYSVQVGLNYKPVPLLDVNLDYKKNFDASKLELGAKLTYKLGVDWYEQLNSDNIDNLRRLNGARYDFVDRNNEVVLAYDADVPLVLAEVTGYPMEMLYLFDKVDLKDNWRIKGWDNPDQLDLSKECFSESVLQDCTVALPEYKTSGSDDRGPLVDNIHPLKLTLIHNKTGREVEYSMMTRVRAGIREDEYDVQLWPADELYGKASNWYYVFKTAKLGSHWKIASWDIMLPDGDAWIKATADDVSPECWDSSDFGNCSVKLQTSSASNTQLYGFRAVLRNESLGQEREILFNFALINE